MKIYNKTTKPVMYGFLIPASSVAGERGEGVEIDPPKMILLARVWQKLLADQQAGVLEIEK